MKSIKAQATEWLIEQIKTYRIDSKSNSIKNMNLNFTITGFCDEPTVFICATDDGLVFGYHSIRWDHPGIPTPTWIIKYKLSWETLHPLHSEEKKEKILDMFLKTIHSRKRQYRKCQFCGDKFPPEHRFDWQTCHGCATKYLGIVY
jgi:hypothetical protein